MMRPEGAALATNETSVVRVRTDLRNAAKVAAAVEKISLEEWLNRAIEDRLGRQAGGKA